MEYQSIIIYTIVKIGPSNKKFKALKNLKNKISLFPIPIFLQVFWKR